MLLTIFSCSYVRLENQGGGVVLVFGSLILSSVPPQRFQLNMLQNVYVRSSQTIINFRYSQVNTQILPKVMSTVRSQRIGMNIITSFRGPLAVTFLSSMNAKLAHAHLLSYRYALRENSCHRHVISSTCCH